jgi:hypothetical protein
MTNDLSFAIQKSQIKNTHPAIAGDIRAFEIDVLS